MDNITEADKYLIYQVEQGIHQRYSVELGMSQEYIEGTVIPRAKSELHVITKQKFSKYFLILADIMDYCHKADIPVGVARGSAGGSLISYVLKITEVEPLRYNLIFERFLNLERYSPPDIDVDLCWDKRQEVLNYVYDKYGHDNVAQIATFGTLSAKSLLDDLGRVYKVPRGDIADIKKIIDDYSDGGKIKYEDLLEHDDFTNAIHKLAEKEPRIIDGMAKLEGLHRHTSLHAGGLIISDQPMHNLAPTFQPSRKENKTAIQYEMNDVEAIGLLKMDLLGLKTITMVDWAEKDVRRLVDSDFYTRKHPIDDQDAFDIINRGDTAGVFQLEGTGITRFAQNMKVESFNDIVALLALYRPGTLDAGTAQQYIDRKNGLEDVVYPHDDLKEVLSDTYGIIVYQEQVMQILGVMGGYSMGKADMMRKAMGKKDAELMTSELNKFRAAAAERGYAGETIEYIADLIETFGRYGFNKSHAVAYAHLTYWTALLKAKYPAQFYSAWLNTITDRDKLGWVIEMMVRNNVEILPPDINKSGTVFTTTGINTVRFGLSAIKGMGKSFVNNTLKNREERGKFTSYLDYCQRLTAIPIDKKKALIGGGAFDFEEQEFAAMHRGMLYTNADALNAYAKKTKTKPDTPIPALEFADKLEPIEMGEMEKEYLSFYLTEDPLRIVQDKLRMVGASVGVHTPDLSGNVVVGGRVTQRHIFNTKKGQKMAFIDIDDGMVSHTVTFFPNGWNEAVSATMADDNFVLIRAEVDMYRGNKTLNAISAEEIPIKGSNQDIIINLGYAKPMDIAHVQSVIEEHAGGSSRVWLKVRTADHAFLLKTKRFITVTDETIEQLQQYQAELRLT